MPKLPTELLTEWFLESKRDLPWRGSPTPYEVWVSEVMLQQTQVAVVIPYFERWMRRFPTIESLARGSKEEVLKLWEGLGYYSRARHLHEAAQYILSEYAGEMPRNKDNLSKIKGLGPYTVGAILSFAFGQKAAAVDANVLRVLARFSMIEEDIGKSSVKERVQKEVEEMLPEKNPQVVMEALIELGAQVCQKKPKCSLCPLQEDCLGYQNGKAALLPIKGKKTEYISLSRFVAVIRYGQEYLLRRESSRKVMKDLCEFPYFDFKTNAHSVKSVEMILKENLAIEPKFCKELEEVSHSFTRFRVKLYPSIWELDRKKDIEGYDWISWEEMKKLPFSSGHRRILKTIERDDARFAHREL